MAKNARKDGKEGDAGDAADHDAGDLAARQPIVVAAAGGRRRRRRGARQHRSLQLGLQRSISSPSDSMYSCSWGLQRSMQQWERHSHPYAGLADLHGSGSSQLMANDGQ